MTTTSAPTTTSSEGQFVRGIGPIQAISLVVEVGTQDELDTLLWTRR